MLLQLLVRIADLALKEEFVPQSTAAAAGDLNAQCFALAAPMFKLLFELGPRARSR